MGHLVEQKEGVLLKYKANNVLRFDNTGGSYDKITFPSQKFRKYNDIDLSSIDKLNGVNSERGVFSYRGYSTKKSYILKNCIQKREFDVYTKHSSFFKENNINIQIFIFLVNKMENIGLLLRTYPTYSQKAVGKQIQYTCFTNYIRIAGIAV
ncbi:hypothetical protein J2S21_003528 [Peribacillus cavernae]|nr:hypothetical protein [Peribacillus cavernae]